MIKKVDHIGIAVKNAEAVAACYRLMGLEVEAVEEVADQKVRVTFIPAGDVRLELLEPTEEDSTVARFLQKRGEGIHHIAFLVDDLQKAIDTCKRNGLRLIDQMPRKGAHNNNIAFLHPASTHGVLVELCAYQKPGESGR